MIGMWIQKRMHRDELEELNEVQQGDIHMDGAGAFLQQMGAED